MKWQEEFKRKHVSFEEAAKQVKSGDFVGTGLATGACSPAMFDAILDRWEGLQNVTISDSVMIRPTKLYDLDYMLQLDGHINYHPSFGMPLSRKIIESRLPDYLIEQSHDLGVRYGEWSDIFIVQVTPPNERGWVNLGLSNFLSYEAIRLGKASGKQRVTIGEVNDQQPVVYGNNWLHVSEFDYFVEHSEPVPAVTRAEPGEKEKIIYRQLPERSRAKKKR